MQAQAVKLLNALGMSQKQFEQLQKNLPNLPQWKQQQIKIRLSELKRRFREERIRGWQPSEPPFNDQKSAYLSKLKIQYLSGGNRSGKTECGVAKAIDYCTGYHPTLSERHPPPVHGRYCGTTWEDGIKGVILKKFQTMVKRSDLFGWSWDKAWSEKSRTLAFCLNGQKNVRGSTIRFYTYVQKVSTYGGDDLDFVIMDEHGAKPFYTENIARLVDRNGWIMLTETPEAGMTWEDGEILERFAAGDEDFAVWLFDSRKNKYLDKDGLASLIKTIGDDEELFNTKIRGIMSALAGRIYPMFNENVHPIDDFEIPAKSPRWHKSIIMDPHKKKETALLWLAWSKDGDVYAYREAKYKPTRGGIADLASFIRVKSAGDGKIHDWIMDEALGGTPKPDEFDIFGMEGMIDQLNKEGLPFQGTNINSSKAVESGIMKVSEFLRRDPINGRPRLRIFRSCPLLIKELQIYQYKKSKPADEEAYRELVRKIQDDLVDCLRYGLMAEPAMGFGPVERQEYDQESGIPKEYGSYIAPDVPLE